MLKCALANSLEFFVADDAFEGGAFVERHIFDNFELFGEDDIREDGTVLECALANSLEVFVEEDAFEGRTTGENFRFDDFELIGESDTREGIASLECDFSSIRNVDVLTEYHTHEMATASERKRWNALKFGTSQ